MCVEPSINPGQVRVGCCKSSAIECRRMSIVPSSVDSSLVGKRRRGNVGVSVAVRNESGIDVAVAMM